MAAIVRHNRPNPADVESGRQSAIIGAMDKRDRDNESDDGIVSEDLTQLVEHIELTSPQRLPDAPEWEMATPAADLDDAPILIEEGLEDIPDLDLMGAVEDLELFTETQFDIGRHLQPAASDTANELAAERTRWQKRVDSLQRSLDERDRMLRERDRRIEELSAKLATRTLEREGLEAGLGDFSASVEAEPAMPAALATVPAPAAEPTQSSLDNTGEVPELVLPRVKPAAAVETTPRMRRYLIGVDLVGQVHEVTSHRVNIGRTHENDLRIVDPTVSRLHAMLTLRGGEAMLVDANSRNGVFVNGMQVRYAKLEDGDLVTFGTVRYRYRVGSGVPAGTWVT